MCAQLEYAEAATTWREDEQLRLVGAFSVAGGFEGVVRLMVCRPQEPDVQARCCYALSGMALGESGCRRACDAGAFGVLATALSNFARDAAVLLWGATAVLRLTHDSATRAYRAIADGAEAALAKPLHDKQLKRDIHPVVTSKVELAHRWLAYNARLIGDARGRVSPPPQ